MPRSRAVGSSSVSIPGCAALWRIITQSHGAFVDRSVSARARDGGVEKPSARTLPERLRCSIAAYAAEDLRARANATRTVSSIVEVRAAQLAQRAVDVGFDRARIGVIAAGDHAIGQGDRAGTW